MVAIRHRPQGDPAWRSIWRNREGVGGGEERMADRGGGDQSEGANQAGRAAAYMAPQGGNDGARPGKDDGSHRTTKRNHGVPRRLLDLLMAEKVKGSWVMRYVGGGEEAASEPSSPRASVGPQSWREHASHCGRRRRCGGVVTTQERDISSWQRGIAVSREERKMGEGAEEEEEDEGEGRMKRKRNAGRVEVGGRADC